MKEFTIVRGLFDNRKRQLIVDENFIKFENNDLKESLYTIIKKEDIIGIRYGIHFIRGFEFYIGREYQIFIRTKFNNEIKIGFKLFYRRKVEEKHQLFYDIVNELWNYYFNDILQEYLDKLVAGETFYLSGIKIEKNKIIIDNREILFENVDITNYHHHFIVFSKTDQYHNRMLYYLQDKDAPLLSQLLKIIKAQNE